MLTISLSLNEILRLVISVGTFIFLLDLLYWVIRFGRDYWDSRAIVALGLFLLMTAMATRQIWSVYITGLGALAPDLHQELRTFNTILRVATVFFAIFSTRFLRYAFEKEKERNGEKKDGR